MITVYCVQHGIALDKQVDETRPLSDTGRAEVLRMTDFLRDHNIQINRVFHSGKLRAQQTADLFAQGLSTTEISAHSGMNPNDNPAALIARLEHDHAMYVGHLPNIERVVSKLISGDDSVAAIKYQNAGIACVEIEEGSATLKWFITPDLC